MKSVLSLLVLVFAALVQSAFAAPATLVQNVTYNGQTITLRLTRENLRGNHFELLSQNAAGGYDPITPVDERSYIGSVDGYPGAVSCGVQLDNGTFKGAVYFDRGATWFTLGSSVVETRALDYSNFTAYQIPASPTVQPGQAGTSMYGFDLGVDADYDYFTTAGSSMATALEGIEYSVAVVRGIYMRDALLRPYLSRVIVRSTLAKDPYTGLNQGGYLGAVGTEWNTNQTSAIRDTVAGVSPSKIGGGLAWVGVIATSSAYSVNQSNSNGNFDVVFRHELGHNWGCGHFVGGSPEGAGLMGGNAPGRFSCCEVHNVLNHRNSRLAFLDNEGTYTAIELPPYASLDVVEVTQPMLAPTSIAVLANDHDANGQALSLVSFSSNTANGGTVTQQGQELLYTPPGGFIGTDWFTYTVTDSAGRTATGTVVASVTVNDPLRLYLPLNETTGTSATDESVYGNSATLAGTDFATATTPGVFGNAVTLDGTDDRLSVSNVRLKSNTVTMTAWIKPGGGQADWAGILVDRSSTAGGLIFGTNNELRYLWNGTNYWWNSGLVPAADTWTFVALVIEPTRARIYMNSGAGFQVATNNAPHSVQTFGTTYVGSDPNGDPRFFNGVIDEARIYSQTMSQAQLQTLYDGGGAGAPTPFDGATGVASNLLGWAPGASATGYNIYIGTNQAAVAAATTASPEFVESTANPYHYASLADQTTYYWRVDTLTASTTLPGQVWSFTTASVQSQSDSILVNFNRGGGEAFAGGALIGPTFANSSRWNAATGASGNLTSLKNLSGSTTATGVQWYSSNTWGNNDGTGDDQHRLSVGYLDDGAGTNGDGKGVLVTFSNIPFANYRIYGLFATDQNSSGSVPTTNFNVNGIWALGGGATTTAAAWGSINANQTANGEAWTQIVPGSVQGNYWTVESSGSTCTIIGEMRSGNNRGCLTGVIIEEIAANHAPTWDSDPVDESAAIKGVAYASTLADDATDSDGDALTFARVSGPAWLTVGTNGDLDGTPGAGDVGPQSWTVSVSDGIAAAVEVTLNITVQPDNDGDGIPDAIDPDDDQDGMPDAWEIAHSLDPLVDDKDGNPDLDLHANWQEYVFDTAPQDAASVQGFHIDLDPVSGEPRIHFSTSANRLYTVEASTDLDAAGWQELAPEAPGTGAEVIITDTDGVSPNRFYRLRAKLP